MRLGRPAGRRLVSPLRLAFFVLYHVVLFLVSPSRLALASRHPVSPLRLVLYRVVVPSRLCRAVGRNDPCVASSLSSCYIVIALASSRLVRLVLRCVKRDVFSRLAVSSRFYSVPSFSCVIAFSRLALLSRWAGQSCEFCPMSSGILCRLVFSLASLISVRLRSSQFVIVSVGVSLRGACGEIELTKTARFNALVVSVPYRVRACVVGDSNMARSNDSEARGTVAGLFGRLDLSYMPAGRSRQSILPPAHPTPWGRGTI